MNAPLPESIRLALEAATLDDKYTLASGRAFMSGVQALVRLPMLQRQRDAAVGLNTAGFISGYRGSPLGGYDQSLWAAKKHLAAQNIVFQPGVNEELAATAVWGTQQIEFDPTNKKFDGVFGIWYGKGPGVDRSLDVFRHANFAGPSPHGGVIALAGDDHAAVSSTTAHQSEFNFQSLGMPMLHPATVQEYLDFGLLGFAMSRFAGVWVGFKCVTETVESSASVTIDPLALKIVIPEGMVFPPDGVHIRHPDPMLAQERRLLDFKLPAAIAFARANKIDREVIAALGSKEGFANLAMAITAPGDVVLVPNPAYPIHAFGFMIAGAAIRHVPATSPEEYLSKIGVATRHSVPSPLAMVVNYPSNPTAQVVGLDFYKEVIKFAKKHEIWVLSDLAYADIYFDDANPPPSILQVDGAKDIAIEFQSLSKTYSMPGWRMGFAAGNEKLIGALARIKSYLDYGAFTPIQVAAAAALNGPQTVVDEIRAVYKSRRDVLVKSMAQAGWDIPAPDASMFAWAPVPENYRELGSMEFAKDLLIHAKVAVSPGIGFGEYGEGYVRVALVENEHRIRQAARNVKKFLTMGTNMSPSDLASAK